VIIIFEIPLQTYVCGFLFLALAGLKYGKHQARGFAGIRQTGEVAKERMTCGEVHVQKQFSS
jgi:hypothetical protein